MNDVTKQMADHLSFLGYEIEDREKTIGARHATHFNILIYEIGGGVLFKVSFNSEDGASDDALRLMANDVNTDAIASRFYLSKDRAFIGESWLPMHYDRSAFGSFMDNLHRDQSRLAGHARATELLK